MMRTSWDPWIPDIRNVSSLLFRVNLVPNVYILMLFWPLTAEFKIGEREFQWLDRSPEKNDFLTDSSSEKIKNARW